MIMAGFKFLLLEMSRRSKVAVRWLTILARATEGIECSGIKCGVYVLQGVR